jgi:hypothetical protein
LFNLSESRGREASGIAFLLPQSIRVAKHAVAASDLISQPEYNQAFEAALGTNGNYLQAVIGHSRLVTNGAQHINENNQPVIKSGLVGIHNGIITNVDELWEQFPELPRQYGIDTEILLALIRKFLNGGQSLIQAVRQAYKLIEGVASIALFFDDFNVCLLASNNGSLYVGLDKTHQVVVFGSERYILQQLAKRKFFSDIFGDLQIHQIRAGNGCLLHLDHFQIDTFALQGEDSLDVSSLLEKNRSVRLIQDISPDNGRPASLRSIPGEGPYILSPSFVDEFPKNRDRVAKLRRCTCCILPETMPFIEFDAQGVCNYCRSYKKLELKGLDALMELIEPYRKGTGEPECLVTFSGGRDSSYGVHFVKNVLKLHPVTYTYDWGMVTDLARRNQMRLCGKLGIEHILVSADIAWKRANIRRNVTAWLRKPHLGTVPLFMAGDKQYFYYANKVSQQTGCKVIVLCENLLETTRFKSGYCGIPPRHGTAHTYTLSVMDKARMALFYGWQYLQNPAFINASLVDTLSAFACYYVIPHPYVNLYEYIQWDEEEIASTLIREYNWETATDTKNTWRIGDGTASFYNYIYYTIGGLTENDTFRSNQIREGALTRPEALRLAARDNEPRYESIQWYCDIIGIDFDDTIRTINATPKLYERIS